MSISGPGRTVVAVARFVDVGSGAVVTPPMRSVRRTDWMNVMAFFYASIVRVSLRDRIHTDTLAGWTDESTADRISPTIDSRSSWSRSRPANADAVPCAS